MIIKKLFYLVIVVLILQVIKTVSIKLNSDNSFLVGIVVLYLQTFCLLFPVLYFVISGVFPKGLGSLKKKLTILISSVAIIGCLEAVTIYTLNHPQRLPEAFHRPFFYYYEKYDFKIIQFDAKKAVYDSSLFYRLKPNTQFLFSNREFRDSFYVNKMGVRDTDSSLYSPAIICVGDSYFMGWGVDQSSCFAKLLEKRTSVKVLNAAVSSYGTARELALLKKLDRSRCKAIVIQYCANDWFENRSFISNSYQLNISPREVFESKLKEEEQKHFYLPGLHFAILSQLILRHGINQVHPIFNLRLDREVKVSDERKQAEDFLNILTHEIDAFGSAHIYVTSMDSFERVDNSIVDEMKNLLTDPRFNILKNRISFIPTRNLFNKEDYYFLDLHAKSSAYKKLSALVSDSILSRQTINK